MYVLFADHTLITFRTRKFLTQGKFDISLHRVLKHLHINKTSTQCQISALSNVRACVCAVAKRC